MSGKLPKTRVKSKVNLKGIQEIRRQTVTLKRVIRPPSCQQLENVCNTVHALAPLWVFFTTSTLFQMKKHENQLKQAVVLCKQSGLIDC